MERRRGEITSRVKDGKDVSLIAKSNTRKGVIVMDTKQEKQSGQYNDTNCQKNVVWSHPRRPFI